MYFLLFSMTNSNEIQVALKAAENPLLLETSEDLAVAASQWSSACILGVDTEFLRERTYRAELGLVQVSDGTTAWLIDVIKIENLDPLREMFSNSQQLKVFHSASEDFEALWHALQVSPDPVIDTQIACAMTGQPLQMSYHNAIKWLTDIEVDKEQTRSNWIRRPLNKQQLHYAATDVVFLPLLTARVRDTLEQQKRWEWLQEDVGRLISQSREPIDPETVYLRIAGAANLDPSQLRVLRQLAAWREGVADSRNLARGFVIKDAELMRISRALPSTIQSLSEFEEIHVKTVQRHGKEILEAVQEGLKSTAPASAPGPLDNRQKKLVGEMRKIVLSEAEAYSIDPALLASRKILEALLRALENNQAVPERLTGWRSAVITEKLVALVTQSRESNTP
jgi:ribonuclease D